MGGYLKYVDSKYIVLTSRPNGQGISWSVQRTKGTSFFKLVDFKDQAEIVILEQERIITSLKKKNSELVKSIKKC